MKQAEKMYGLAQDKDKRLIYLYTKRSSVLFQAVKYLLMVLFSPLWIPLYALIFLGLWSETALDWLSKKMEQVLVKLVPRKL